MGQDWHVVPASRRSGTSFLTDLSELRLPGISLGYRIFGIGRLSAGKDEPEDEDFESLVRPLVGNSFGLNNTVDPLHLALGLDVMRMFIYAPLPDEFHVNGDAFPDRQGYVLYAVDLPTSATQRIVSPADEAVPSDAASSQE